MDVALGILLIGLTGFSLGSAVYYGVVLYRIIRVDRTLPTARSGLDLPEPDGGWPGLCIVIPAHNEADVIGDLVESLRRQDYPNLCVVFALDRCTDDTERIVREGLEDQKGESDPRFEIVIVDECPDDWAGKVHAVHEGVTRSRGAQDAGLLLFTDADTIFDPALCRATVALLAARGLGMLSLLSRLTNEHWYERVVQPAAAFELIREYPLDRINREDNPRPFANGQFMLFRRDLYDALGGHERVHDRLLEDLAFAREITRRRRELGDPKWGVYMGAGMLCCRMYRSWEAFTRGWKRIFTEAAGRRKRHLRKWSRRQRLTGTALPLMSAISIVVGLGAMRSNLETAMGPMVLITGLCGTTAFVLAMTRIYAQQGIGLGWAIGFPIGAWLSGSIQAQAGKDLSTGKKTVWGGREYSREVRA